MAAIKYNNIKVGTLFILICVILVYTRLTYTKEPVSKELFEMPFHIERKLVSAPRVLSGVPLTIYESWHSNMVPTKMRETIYSLLDMNPEFDYYLYSDDACRKFIQDNFNEDVVSAFDSLKPGAYKSDLWRYCILYKKGGVYLDIKFKSLVPLAPIIEKNPEIFVRDIDFNISFYLKFHSEVYNAFMVSPPNNKIFKDCIEDIVNSCKFKLYKSTPLDITGPGCLIEIIQKNKDEKYIYSVKFYKGLISYPSEKIWYNNLVLFEAYLDYRSEQKLFQKMPHYSQLWFTRNVYN